MPARKDLLEWFSAVAPSKPRLICTHGEDRAREVFSELIRPTAWDQALNARRLGDVIEM